MAEELGAGDLLPIAKFRQLRLFPGRYGWSEVMALLAGCVAGRATKGEAVLWMTFIHRVW